MQTSQTKIAGFDAIQYDFKGDSGTSVRACAVGIGKFAIELTYHGDPQTDDAKAFFSSIRKK
jgi:hypothetical protein